MNKWFRRAVGTVGIAGGALLLGTGAAQADDSVPAAEDPQLLHGLVEDVLSPSGGAGMSVDTTQRTTSENVRFSLLAARTSRAERRLSAI